MSRKPLEHKELVVEMAHVPIEVKDRCLVYDFRRCWSMTSVTVRRPGAHRRGILFHNFAWPFDCVVVQAGLGFGGPVGEIDSLPFFP